MKADALMVDDEDAADEGSYEPDEAESAAGDRLKAALKGGSGAEIYKAFERLAVLCSAAKE